jgi:hypothetical protein
MADVPFGAHITPPRTSSCPPLAGAQIALVPVIELSSK